MGFPEFSPRNCTACWRCVAACPSHAIKKVGILWHRHALPDYDVCIGCGLCTRVCRRGCFRVPAT